MPHSRRVTGLVVAAALFAATAGCKDEGEKLVPVSGAVTAAGKAVPSGTLTFYPDGDKGNKSQHLPTGVLEPDGRFDIYVSGPRKGAPLGWYKVVVYAVDDPQPGKPNKYFVHRKYTEIGSTPLSIEVVENPTPDRYDMKLQK
jgi:hypothetical protein